MLEKLSKNAKITLSILLILFGIFLVTYNYFDTIKHNVFNHQNIRLMEQTVVIEESPEEIIEDEVITTSTVVNTTVNDNNNLKNNYIGILSVPDVNIKRGFVAIDSKYNSIRYNVMVIQGSTMPDEEFGNLILAAHRGNSSVSFFENLYKLNIGSYAYINYNNKVYKYELKRTYTEPKDGILTIRRNADASCLTLITCTRDDKKTQTIFSYELVSVE